MVFSSPIKAQCLPEGSEWPRITAGTGPNDSEVPSLSDDACEKASDLVLGLKQSVIGSVHLLCFNKTRKSIPSTELSHKERTVHLASRRNHSWAGPSTETPPPLPTIPGSERKSSLSAERGFRGGSVGKNPPASAGDRPGLIPGSERPPGGGRGSPLQSSCPENPMDRGAWWATVLGATKSRTRLTDD